MINHFVETMYIQNEITSKCMNYLRVDNAKTSLFYMLPKIHKGVIPPPGRPILSANGCPTENISALVDPFLKPLVPKMKSYVKDTTDFIQKINSLGDLPDNSILVSMDVTSLYTNIPNTKGVRGAFMYMQKHRKYPRIPSNTSLAHLLYLVLRSNNFQFNGKNYLQVGGTAMGTRVAPSLANIFMENFESKFIYSWHKQPL